MENNEKYVLGCLGCGEEFEFDTIEEYEAFRDNNSHLFDSRGDFICEHCIDNYYQCGDCEEFVDCFNGTYIEDCDKWVCNDCLNNYSYCDDCDNYVSGTTYTAYRNGREVSICEHCRSDIYCECNGCHDLIHYDDLQYDDDNDCCYCENCYEYKGGIGDYHETANNGFTKQLLDGEDENTMTFGAEIEVDYGDNKNDVAKNFRKTIPCGTDYDGSLSNGFEVVTQPFSWNWLLEHKEDFKKAFQYAIDNGWKSHDTSTCGQHIHVSRPKDTRIIDRIAFIMETYKDELIRFSRRNDTHWCRFYSDIYRDCNDRFKKDLKTIKGLSKMIDGNKYEHRIALNLQHDATLEFRIFRGTLNFETFMANIQLVKNITELCSDLNLDIKNITWDKLTQGEYVRPYVESKGIFTNKIPRDLSNDIIKYENKLNKLCYKMVQDIIVQINKAYNVEFQKVCKGDADYQTIVKFEKIRTSIVSDNNYLERALSNLKGGYRNNALDYLGYLDIVSYTSIIKNKLAKYKEQYDKIQREYDNFINTI